MRRGLRATARARAVLQSACRAAWNREHLGDPALQASALSWSLAAMSEATALLPAAKPRDLPQAFAAIGEAVWWITMVDATLLRHHPALYDSVLAARTPAGRQLIVETLAGLRFVRNWISRETGLQEAIDASKGWRITGWTWKPASEPALAWLPPPAQAWELTRHRAYQARLAGHTIGTTFGNAVTFLAFTGADAASITETSGTRPPTHHRPPRRATWAAPPTCESSRPPTRPAPGTKDLLVLPGVFLPAPGELLPGTGDSGTLLGGTGFCGVGAVPGPALLKGWRCSFLSSGRFASHGPSLFLLRCRAALLGTGARPRLLSTAA